MKIENNNETMRNNERDADRGNTGRGYGGIIAWRNYHLFIGEPYKAGNQLINQTVYVCILRVGNQLPTCGGRGPERVVGSC